MDPNIARHKLEEGNARFASGLRSVSSLAATPELRQELAERGQSPFAIILTCADSRVPAELVFDCGLGELFVVRVAGNIVAPSLIGSIEFAADNFGTSLVVVMGHSGCGAVGATVDAVVSGERPASDNVQNIVLEITPSVREAMRKTRGPSSREGLVACATDLNVRHSVLALLERSAVLSRRIAEGRLAIVGATYDLRSGKVRFLEEKSDPLRSGEQELHSLRQ